jgi:hypothetical protein
VTKSPNEPVNSSPLHKKGVPDVGKSQKGLTNISTNFFFSTRKNRVTIKKKSRKKGFYAKK